MKQIGDIATVACMEKELEKKQSKSLDPLICQLVDKVFTKMALLCRGFDSFYSDRNRLNAEKMQWCLLFSKVGIRTQKQIQKALNRLELYKYPNPPQLGEFMAWCSESPSDFGLPELEEAYKISLLMNRQFSEFKPDCPRAFTVIRHTINEIGTSIYRQMSDDNARKVFKSYYEISCRLFLSGSLKEIPSLIIDDSKNTAEHDKRQKISTGFENCKNPTSALSKIREMLR